VVPTSGFVPRGALRGCYGRSSRFTRQISSIGQRGYCLFPCASAAPCVACQGPLGAPLWRLSPTCMGAPVGALGDTACATAGCLWVVHEGSTRWLSGGLWANVAPATTGHLYVCVQLTVTAKLRSRRTLLLARSMRWLPGSATATQARQRTSDTSRAAMQCPSGPQCVHGLDDIDGTPEGTASPLWIPTGSPLASHSFAQLRTASHWPEFLRSHWVPSGFR